MDPGGTGHMVAPHIPLGVFTGHAGPHATLAVWAVRRLADPAGATLPSLVLPFIALRDVAAMHDISVVHTMSPSDDTRLLGGTSIAEDPAVLFLEPIAMTLTVNIGEGRAPLEIYIAREIDGSVSILSQGEWWVLR